MPYDISMGLFWFDFSIFVLNIDKKQSKTSLHSYDFDINALNDATWLLSMPDLACHAPFHKRKPIRAYIYQLRYRQLSVIAIA